MHHIIQSIIKKMKYFSTLILVFLLVSCNDKEVLLPQVATTIVADVKDHSPIYMFFTTEGKDTLVDVNRSNSISSTNWIFNIDKRLPLRLVIPELMKLQAKKESSVHKSETSENYFSYSDSIKKSLAFLPFTKVNYVLEKPKFGVIVYFDKKNRILVDSFIVERDSLENYLNKLPDLNYHNINFCFDKDVTYGDYIKNVIFVRSLEMELIKPEEFIY
jgi:hypothetical protein